MAIFKGKDGEKRVKRAISTTFFRIFKLNPILIIKNRHLPEMKKWSFGRKKHALGGGQNHIKNEKKAVIQLFFGFFLFIL